ncbi:MAG: ribonuclease HI family protein [bacterium]
MSEIFTLFGDGGSRGNPGPAASGFVVYKAESESSDSTGKNPTGGLGSHKLDLNNLGQKIISASKFLGDTTNNQAEWQALTLGLKAIMEYCVDNKLDSKSIEIEVFMDSLLVVQQAKGVYKVKNLDLKSHLTTLRELQGSFKATSFYHIYREFNKVADSLVNECLDGQA